MTELKSSFMALSKLNLSQKEIKIYFDFFQMQT